VVDMGKVSAVGGLWRSCSRTVDFQGFAIATDSIKGSHKDENTMVTKGVSGRPEKLGYRKLTLFFMSGTGNSYRNAKWIESEAVKQGL
jgi:hypothetical protein